MTKQALIESYGTFYHVTPSENIENITDTGLKAKSYPPYEYRHTKDPKAQICFTPHKNLEKQKKVMQEAFDNAPIAVYKIDAAVLARKSVGLDHTHVGIDKAYLLNEVEGLKLMIDEYGTIACFENIPLSDLELLP